MSKMHVNTPDVHRAVRNGVLDKRIRAVFFDDQKRNFHNAAGICPTTLNIHSRLGTRIKSPPFPRLKNVHDLMYKDAGISLPDLKRWHRIFASDKSDHVKKVFFDWDRTLSSWDGLPAHGKPATWINEAKKDGMWEKYLDSLFGSEARLQAVIDLLVLLQEQKRVMIVTAQEDGTSIRAILRALATDYKAPQLAKVRVVGNKERQSTTKYAFFLDTLQNHCSL